MTDLHPDIEALGFLLGAWEGTGRGDYPTIDPFEYGERITIDHVGKPYLYYHQLTWSIPGDAPLHSEAGYYRATTSGVELLLSQPSGVAEVHEGSLDGSTIDLRSVGVLLTPTAVEVSSVGRHIEVNGDVMRYRLDLEAVGEPYQFHLEAELHRT